MNDRDKSYRYEVKVDIHRGGVTGEPMGHMIGLGGTIGDASQDALTALGATKIRDGDFLKVTVKERLRR